MPHDRFRLRAGHDGRESSRIGLLNRLYAAEVFEQTPGRARSYSRNFQQFGGAVAHLAAFAVEGDGEAVGFVADLLHKVQDGRVVVERDRFIFLSVDVDDLLALGDGGEWLV